MTCEQLMERLGTEIYDFWVHYTLILQGSNLQSFNYTWLVIWIDSAPGSTYL